MPSTASDDPTDEARDVLRSYAFYLLEMCENVGSELGPRLNREWRDHRAAAEVPLDCLIEERLIAAQLAFSRLLDAFADVVGPDILDAMISVDGNTPDDARDAVASWITLIAPLIDRTHAASSVRYEPRQFVEALWAIKPELLRGALWATEGALAKKNTRTF